jgi:DNA segregation ATPase FtsK/SpoIIIE-like protein
MARNKIAEAHVEFKATGLNEVTAQSKKAADELKKVDAGATKAKGGLAGLGDSLKGATEGAKKLVGEMTGIVAVMATVATAAFKAGNAVFNLANHFRGGKKRAEEFFETLSGVGPRNVQAEIDAITKRIDELNVLLGNISTIGGGVNASFAGGYSSLKKEQQELIAALRSLNQIREAQAAKAERERQAEQQEREAQAAKAERDRQNEQRDRERLLEIETEVLRRRMDSDETVRATADIYAREEQLILRIADARKRGAEVEVDLLTQQFVLQDQLRKQAIDAIDERRRKEAEALKEREAAELAAAQRIADANAAAITRAADAASASLQRIFDTQGGQIAQIADLMNDAVSQLRLIERRARR